ncbi:hypothetical protein Q4574_08090 [Aliiglaciecola sp. 3_MG-2023]|uniref:hypothetical protein n=1 Tax=Aliiglaciecola sp. 3_MG-2023 TaxID=3062644 RepID=UPI0026E3A63D|nr:hypothetical protein [Aliiglaciecola sp. 3_MG-2023]MDO6693242.1 hypothetical protein [Aliiglaciecola sp. 3_MG-2023]
MVKQLVTPLMIIALLFSQGVSALVAVCDMENMPEMNHIADVSDPIMVQQQDSHRGMQHGSDEGELVAQIPVLDEAQYHSMQSSQDCCNQTCDCEHGTAFSAALVVANPFPYSLINHTDVIAEQFRALDAHTSNLIKPPII